LAERIGGVTLYVRSAPGRATGTDVRLEQRDPFIVIKNIYPANIQRSIQGRFISKMLGWHMQNANILTVRRFAPKHLH